MTTSFLDAVTLWILPFLIASEGHINRPDSPKVSEGILINNPPTNKAKERGPDARDINSRHRVNHSFFIPIMTGITSLTSTVKRTTRRAIRRFFGL